MDCIRLTSRPRVNERAGTKEKNRAAAETRQASAIHAAARIHTGPRRLALAAAASGPRTSPPAERPSPEPTSTKSPGSKSLSEPPRRPALRSRARAPRAAMARAGRRLTSGRSQVGSGAGKEGEGLGPKRTRGSTGFSGRGPGADHGGRTANGHSGAVGDGGPRNAPAPKILVAPLTAWSVGRTAKGKTGGVRRGRSAHPADQDPDRRRRRATTKSRIRRDRERDTLAQRDGQSGADRRGTRSFSDEADAGLGEPGAGRMPPGAAVEVRGGRRVGGTSVKAENSPPAHAGLVPHVPPTPGASRQRAARKARHSPRRRRPHNDTSRGPRQRGPRRPAVGLLEQSPMGLPTRWRAPARPSMPHRSGVMPMSEREEPHQIVRRVGTSHLSLAVPASVVTTLASGVDPQTAASPTKRPSGLRREASRRR